MKTLQSDRAVHPLVVRFGALGDMVMLTPMLKTLAQRYGQPCDVVTSGEWSRTIYDGLSCIRHVEVIRSRRTPYLIDREQRALVMRLSERASGPVWSLERLPKVDWLIGRAGYAESDVVSASNHPRGPEEHEVDYNLRLTQIDPIRQCSTEPVHSGGQALPFLHVTAAELEESRAWCTERGVDARSFIVIHPGNKRTMAGGWRRRPSNIKHWADERWAAVIAEILEADRSLSAVINAAPREVRGAKAIRQRVPAAMRGSVVIGDVTLRQLIALLALARGCISTDSGPAHAGAAVGCPVLVLFGATNPRVHRPLGRPGTVLSVFSREGVPFISRDGSEWQPDAAMENISVRLVTEGWWRLMEEVSALP